MSLQLYLAYVAASIALALLPGPMVTLVIANSLRYGPRAGFINIGGAQAGMAVIVAIVGVGLATLMATAAYWFDWVRFAGAAYLVWLGIKLMRAPVQEAGSDTPPPPPRGGFFLQGFLVMLSNPKVLVFFGAFIPQFVDMNGNHFVQVAILGATFMVAAAMSDALYALLAGRARVFLRGRGAKLLAHLSGLFMIGGGVWLAFTRVK